jgi:hypothetical protein
MNKIIYELAMFTLHDANDNSYSDEIRNDLKKTFKEKLEIND